LRNWERDASRLEHAPDLLTQTAEESSAIHARFGYDRNRRLRLAAEQNGQIAHWIAGMHGSFQVSHRRFELHGDFGFLAAPEREHRCAVGSDGDGLGDAVAVASVVGEPFDAFERSWRGWLKAQHLRAHPGLAPEPLRFARPKEKPTDERGRDEDDAQQVEEERARKLVRLGGMLRARGRLAPAAVEYEKAQQFVGAGHFVVAVKLGRTLLALGQYDRAIAAAGVAMAGRAVDSEKVLACLEILQRSRKRIVLAGGHLVARHW